ncbi:EAL domain-containing protein [Ralstonia pseudosolanacearum]|uniref:EAL domain-containing protein n=1 Tax=Ralstonia pseudosolanacearum TaxID=1310165 RepID=UPI003CF262C3
MKDEKTPQRDRGTTPKRLAITAGVVSSLIISGIATYEAVDIHDRAYEEGRGNLLVYSAALSRQVSEIAKSQQVVVAEITRELLEDGPYQPNQVKTALARSIVSQSAVSALFIYDLQGKLLLEANQRPIPQLRPVPNFLPPSKSAGAEFLGSVPAIPSHLAASEFVSSSSGQTRWVVTTWNDFSSVAETVRAITAGSPYNVALLSREGRLLMNFSPSERYDLAELHRDVQVALATGKDGVPIHETQTTGATEKVIKSIYGGALLLRVSVSDASIDSGWHSVTWYLAGLSTAGIALIWMLIGIVLRHIRSLEAAGDLAEAGETKFVEILSHLNDGVLATDIHGRIRFANWQACALLGVTTSRDLVGRVAQEILPEGLRSPFTNLCASRTPTASNFEWEGSFPTLGGKAFDAEVRAFVTGADEGDGAVLTIHDASHQKAHEARLSKAATSDPVSNLPNLYVFRDHLSRLLSSSNVEDDSCHAVLAIQVTISGGLPLSEGLQQLAADRLRFSTRDSDSLASDGDGRYFVLVRDVVEPVDVASLATRLGTVFDAPVTVGDSRLRLATKIGISIFPFDSLNEASLVATATSTLDSLAEDQPFCFANDAVTRQLARFNEQADNLARAIKEGRVYLRYNPLVGLATGIRMGAIAVPFVKLPEQSVLLARCSSIVEEAQMSSLADKRVLKSVAADLAGKPASYIRRLFVPVHRDHFLSPGFVDEVQELFPLAFAYGRLAFLVSELSSTRSATDARTTVSALNALGIQTYLSEFGAGLASLSQLVSIGVAGVVVDKSVITEIDDEDSAFAFLTALTASAEATGLRVLASGVDSVVVAKLLSNMGVTGSTGSLYGKNLSLEEIASRPYFGDEESEFACSDT